MASVGRVVAEFGLSAATWRRLADRGEVASMRVGNRRYFLRSACRAWILGDAPGARQRPARRREEPIGRGSGLRALQEVRALVAAGKLDLDT